MQTCHVGQSSHEETRQLGVNKSGYNVNFSVYQYCSGLQVFWKIGIQDQQKTGEPGRGDQVTILWKKKQHLNFYVLSGIPMDSQVLSLGFLSLESNYGKSIKQNSYIPLYPNAYPNFALWTLVRKFTSFIIWNLTKKIKFYISYCTCLKSVVSDYSDSHKDNTCAAYVRNSSISNYKDTPQ